MHARSYTTTQQQRHHLETHEKKNLQSGRKVKKKSLFFCSFFLVRSAVLKTQIDIIIFNDTLLCVRAYVSLDSNKIFPSFLIVLTSRSIFYFNLLSLFFAVPLAFSCHLRCIVFGIVTTELFFLYFILSFLQCI